ncbi:MAG: response regulator transcription factor [Chloroflexi bacterium]|nr:response regulator transcription factor [Chloroflexota bacterium]MCL5276004.1 response regulator transcription factor [Chloroflexota bacterium]
MLLNSQAHLQVVGEAGDGREALALAESLQPDLILLDLTMPGLSGIEALPVLRRLAPGAHILILTMHDDVSYLRQALRKGASGYVLKKAADSELLNAIQAVMRGEMYIHAGMTDSLIKELVPDINPHPASGTEADPWQTLSEREREVLRLVARGHTNSEIAGQLSISVKTVETYRARGMEKIGLRTRAQLLQAALEKGLLD